jgi:hypothetical protein
VPAGTLVYLEQEHFSGKALQEEGSLDEEDYWSEGEVCLLGF